MTPTQAVILSAVEGVTEFLPISSTGHLVLASKLLGIPQTEFVKSFEIAIQLGAILSVITLYAKKLMLNKRLLKLVTVSFLPSAVVGLVLYKFIKESLIGNTQVTLWALFIGGIILIWWEKRRSLLVVRQGDSSFDSRNISFSSAFKIGLAQSISMIPGVSRAAATIIGGMMVGLSRQAAVEYSFLLAIPTMAAATGLDLVKSAFQFNVREFGLMGVGFISSFLVAAAAIRWLTKYVRHHSLWLFGVYRILLAVIFFGLFF